MTPVSFVTLSYIALGLQGGEAKGNDLSVSDESHTCMTDCFDKKRSCDDNRALASGRNSCGDEQRVCRQSCATHRRMNAIDPQPMLDVSFRPIIKDLI